MNSIATSNPKTIEKYVFYFSKQDTVLLQIHNVRTHLLKIYYLLFIQIIIKITIF